METRRGNRLSIQVLSILALAGAVLVPGQVHGQPFEIKPPAEWIVPSSPDNAKPLTGMEEWELVDGQTLVAELLEWFDNSGVLVFRNQVGHFVYYPARVLAKDRQEYAARLLEPKHQEVAPYANLTRLVYSQGLIQESSCVTTSAVPLTISGDKIIFRIRDGYASAPVSAFDVDAVKAIKYELVEWETKPNRWSYVNEVDELIATLVGQQGDHFIFRDELRQVYLAVPNSEFLFAKSDLSENARLAAEKELQRIATLSPPVKPREPLTRYHVWLGAKYFRLGPAEPISIQNDKTLVARSPTGEELTFELDTLYPTSELDVRCELAARQVRLEHSDASEADLQPRIAAAMQAARDAVIATNPAKYLSPQRLWRLQDLGRPPRMSVLDSDGDYYVFRYFTTDYNVAVLKEELLAPDRAIAEQLVQQLDSYYAQHPSISRPSIKTPFRILRCVDGNMFEPVRVVALEGQQITLEYPGGSPFTTFLARFHFVDVAETRRLLGQPEPVVARPDPAMRRLATLMEMKYWIPRPVGTERPFGFHARPVGKVGDDYIMRNDTADFLVARQDLDDGLPAEADRILAELADLARAKPDLPQLRPADVPVYRVWVTRLGRFIGPGKPVEVTASGQLSYLTPDGKRALATRFDLTNETLAEIYAQLTLAQQLGPATNDPSLTITPEAKAARLAELRAQYLNDLTAATAASTFPTWKARDLRVAFPGKFLGFDGDDAILEGHGKIRFRMYKFAIAPESLAKMESLANDMSKTAQEPAFQPQDVVMRLLRANRNRMIGPSRPVEVTNNMYISVLPDGRIDQVSVDQIHPQDGGEVRGELYRQATGLTKDPDYDQKFRRPVAPHEMLTLIPPVSDELKRTLDELLTLRQPLWQQADLTLAQSAEVIAISPDGSHLIVADNGLRVVCVGAQEEYPLPVPAPSAETAAFFGKDGKTVWMFDGTAFVERDYLASTTRRSLKDVALAPVAGCLSGDGERLFLVLPNNVLLTTRVAEANVQTVELPAAGPGKPAYKVWAATDGLACAVTWPGHLALERLDPQSGNVTPVRDVEFSDAAAAAVMLPNAMMFGAADRSVLDVAAYDEGRPVTPQVVLGIQPRSLNMITVDEKLYLQCIGRRGDKYSQISSDHFAVLLQLPAQRTFGEPQIIPDVAGPELFVSSNGHVAVHRKTSGGWVVSRQPPVQFNADKRLDMLAATLVSADDLGQIEAVYAYLRSGAFGQLGDYPDEFADLWLDYVYGNAMVMGIQHGGDLVARAEAIMARWYKRHAESTVLKSLAAKHQLKRAWAARGSGYANTVTEEGFREFESRLRKADKLIGQLLTEPEPPSSTYS